MQRAAACNNDGLARLSVWFFWLWVTRRRRLRKLGRPSHARRYGSARASTVISSLFAQTLRTVAQTPILKQQLLSPMWWLLLARAEAATAIESRLYLASTPNTLSDPWA